MWQRQRLRGKRKQWVRLRKSNKFKCAATQQTPLACAAPVAPLPASTLLFLFLHSARRSDTFILFICVHESPAANHCQSLDKYALVAADCAPLLSVCVCKCARVCDAHLFCCVLRMVKISLNLTWLLLARRLSTARAFTRSHIHYSSFRFCVIFFLTSRFVFCSLLSIFIGKFLLAANLLCGIQLM